MVPPAQLVPGKFRTFKNPTDHSQAGLWFAISTHTKNTKNNKTKHTTPLKFPDCKVMGGCKAFKLMLQILQLTTLTKLPRYLIHPVFKLNIEGVFFLSNEGLLCYHQNTAHAVDFWGGCLKPELRLNSPGQGFMALIPTAEREQLLQTSLIRRTCLSTSGNNKSIFRFYNCLLKRNKSLSIHFKYPRARSRSFAAPPLQEVSRLF